MLMKCLLFIFFLPTPRKETVIQAPGSGVRKELDQTALPGSLSANTKVILLTFTDSRAYALPVFSGCGDGLGIAILFFAQSPLSSKI